MNQRFRVKWLSVHALLQAHSDYSEERCHAFVCDLTRERLSAGIPGGGGGVDMASLFFVLSTVAPEKMPAVLENVFDVSNAIFACVNWGDSQTSE